MMARQHGALGPDRYGAELHRQAAAEQLASLETLLCDVAQGQAGVRLRDNAALGALVVEGGIGSVAHRRSGTTRPSDPVRQKRGGELGLGWHQDRTVAVRQRMAVPGFSPWTLKAGMIHVAPPFTLLARMITIRIHLDPVDMANAPLLIAPGSHRSKVGQAAIEATVAACGTAMCLAGRGDIWACATPILHASEPASQPRRRRVLQLDYAAEALPGGVEWLGL